MLFRLLSLVPVTLICFGCGGGFSIGYHDHRPARRHHVRRAHVCTHDCHHHYHDGTRLMVLKGHRHGPGCGHHWDGRHWVLAGRHREPVRAAHVCTRECHHHYHDGAKLIMLKGHRHGPRCGHRWDGTHWLVAKKGKARPHPGKAYGKTRKVKHVHNAHCGCVFDRRGSKWVKVGPGHVHGPRCGHVFHDGRWCDRH